MNTDKALEIARMIDHAVLRPDATDADVEEGCRIAIHYRTATLCVRPSDLELAARHMMSSDVLLSTVIGFPHGDDLLTGKLASVIGALESGASELDVVLNIGKLLSGELKYVHREISLLTDITQEAGAKIKIIFENAYLRHQQKLDACRICSDAGVDWVKTSTGFAGSGATEDDVRLMREHCPESVQIKASGGIRDLDTLLRFRTLGCTRIGTSSTAAILDELQVSDALYEPFTGR